jgi:alpha-beta hydrolase superfamily lysophospholipase
VEDAVCETLAGADVLSPTYKTGWNLAQPAHDVAEELSQIIQEKWSDKGYAEIILIGHSMGALLVRKAFVFARGENDELRPDGTLGTERPWARGVERIILLAGMNRGWSLSPKPKRMSWIKNLALRAGVRVSTLLGTGKFLRQMQRGSPFVANLRIQWINLVRSRKQMPLVVQILGDRDDVVNEDDNIDLLAGRSFVYKQAPSGTTHKSVVELRDPSLRRLFQETLTSHSLQSDYIIADTEKPDPDVQQVIFAMHGIRDFGGWTLRFTNAISNEGLNYGKKIEIRRPSYGYFPMLKFLLVSERQKNVRWFMDQYTEALARYPNATVDFVGHSNGTYLLASALERYVACKFSRAVFAGSVVSRDFPWDVMVRSGRIVAVRNYVASADKVVGIFPSLFERFGGDVGGAGLFGFKRDPAAQLEWHYIAGGHSAAIDDRNFPSIATFLLEGRKSNPPSDIVIKDQDNLTLILSKLNWLVWLALFGIIVGLSWVVAFVWAPHFVPYAWLRVLIFLTFLLGILNTI